MCKSARFLVAPLLLSKIQLSFYPEKEAPKTLAHQLSTVRLVDSSPEGLYMIGVPLGFVKRGGAIFSAFSTVNGRCP